MLTYPLKTAWRALTKHKFYSILNIAGLAAGLTCFTFIALWVNDECSFDRSIAHNNRIFRVVSVEKRDGNVVESAMSSAPMAQALLRDYPEVEAAVRLKVREEIVTYRNTQVLQPGILLTDPSFFTVFDYRLTEGDPGNALREPFSLVLTESAAKQYFGNADPIGRTLLLNMYDSTGRGANYTVTGLMPDPPANTHVHFRMLASFRTIETVHPEILTVDGWGDGSYYTYLKLKKGVDPAAFSAKIARFYRNYIGRLFNLWRSVYSYRLQPLDEIHLRSQLQNEISPNGSITQVIVFGTIGIFILLLAGINYTNLATARAAARAKEVGVKKISGAGERQLMGQFLCESVATAIAAGLVALLLCRMLQPALFEVTGKHLSLFSSPGMLLILFGSTIGLGLAAGLYPAFVLTAFNPSTVLNGSFKSGSRGALLRKILVVTQFVITMILVTGIVIIDSQMAFIRNKDLGYNKDALLFIRVNGNIDVIRGYNAFKDQLLKDPAIMGIATSNSLIAGGLSSGGSETVDAAGKPLAVNTARLRVDADYLDVYGIPLVAGSQFTPRSPHDSIRPILLNEMAVKKFGWKNGATAIGKPFSMGETKGTVIGVVRDFHYASLEEAIRPLAIYPTDGHFSRVTVRADLRNMERALAVTRRKWKEHFPSALFDYDFVSQQVKAQYLAEQRFSTLFAWFSGLSLLIACLGLYGLISYAVLQKTREIGIRKVLGASVPGIALALSGQFLKLVLLAVLISTPIAGIIMHAWLRNFAYRIDLSGWMFTAAGLGVLAIALLTVGVQSVRAAMGNPVRALRTA